MEKRLSNIFKATGVTKVTKIILKSFDRVLEVTSQWKAVKQPVCLLRVVEFLPTFDIQISITFLGKVAKLYFLESPQKSFKIRQHYYQ